MPDDLVELLKGLPFLADASLLIIFFVLFASGRIIPRSWVERLLANKDDQISELRNSVKIQDETIGELMKQNSELLQIAPVTSRALRALVGPKDPS